MMRYFFGPAIHHVAYHSHLYFHDDIFLYKFDGKQVTPGKMLSGIGSLDICKRDIVLHDELAHKVLLVKEGKYINGFDYVYGATDEAIYGTIREVSGDYRMLKYQFDSETVMLGSYSTRFIVGDEIIVARGRTEDGHRIISILDHDFNTKWSFEHDYDGLGLPIIFGDIVICKLGTNSEFDSISPVTMNGQHLFGPDVIPKGGLIIAFGAADGAVLWHATHQESEILSFIVDNQFYVLDPSGLRILEPTTGRVLLNKPLPVNWPCACYPLASHLLFVERGRLTWVDWQSWQVVHECPVPEGYYFNFQRVPFRFNETLYCSAAQNDPTSRYVCAGLVEVPMTGLLSAIEPEPSVLVDRTEEPVRKGETRMIISTADPDFDRLLRLTAIEVAKACCERGDHLAGGDCDKTDKGKVKVIMHCEHPPADCDARLREWVRVLTEHFTRKRMWPGAGSRYRYALEVEFNGSMLPDGEQSELLTDSSQAASSSTPASAASDNEMAPEQALERAKETLIAFWNDACEQWEVEEHYAVLSEQAEAGNVEAAIILARAADQHIYDTDASYWYQLAADRGNQFAKLVLLKKQLRAAYEPVFEIYLKREVEKHPDRGAPDLDAIDAALLQDERFTAPRDRILKEMELLAAEGYAPALNELSQIYNNTDYGVEDTDKAFACLQQSAALEDIQGMINYAYHFCDCDDPPEEDLQRYHALLRKAVDKFMPTKNQYLYSGFLSDEMDYYCDVQDAIEVLQEAGFEVPDLS